MPSLNEVSKDLYPLSLPTYNSIGQDCEKVHKQLDRDAVGIKNQAKLFCETRLRMAKMTFYAAGGVIIHFGDTVGKTCLLPVKGLAHLSENRKWQSKLSDVRACAIAQHALKVLILLGAVFVTMYGIVFPTIAVMILEKMGLDPTQANRKAVEDKKKAAEKAAEDKRIQDEKDAAARAAALLKAAADKAAAEKAAADKVAAEQAAAAKAAAEKAAKIEQINGQLQSCKEEVVTAEKSLNGIKKRAHRHGNHVGVMAEDYEKEHDHKKPVNAKEVKEAYQKAQAALAKTQELKHECETIDEMSDKVAGLAAVEAELVKKISEYDTDAGIQAIRAEARISAEMAAKEPVETLQQQLTAEEKESDRLWMLCINQNAYEEIYFKPAWTQWKKVQDLQQGLIEAQLAALAEMQTAQTAMSIEDQVSIHAIKVILEQVRGKQTALQEKIAARPTSFPTSIPCCEIIHEAAQRLHEQDSTKVPQELPHRWLETVNKLKNPAATPKKDEAPAAEPPKGPAKPPKKK